MVRRTVRMMAKTTTAARKVMTAKMKTVNELTERVVLFFTTTATMKILSSLSD